MAITPIVAAPGPSAQRHNMAQAAAGHHGNHHHHHHHHHNQQHGQGQQTPQGHHGQNEEHEVVFRGDGSYATTKVTPSATTMKASQFESDV